MRKPLRLLPLGLALTVLGTALVAGDPPPSLAYLLIASTAPPPSYVGPGDITSFTAWYGLRAYTAAIAAAGTQHLMTLSRASDSHACDILVATNGGLGLTASCGTGGDNGQSASSFCSSTCSITVMFDQAGSTIGNLTSMGSGFAYPTLAFNCINTTLPCINSDAGVGQMIATSGNHAPSSRQLSVSLVAFNTSGSTGTIPFQQNGVDNYLNASIGNAWTFNGGNAGSITSGTLADNAFHAANISIDLTPSTSTFNGDGTETTSTNLNNDTAPGITVMARSLGSLVLQQTELGFIDGTTWALSIRSKLCDNQGSYWGTTKGTHCNSSGT